MTTSMDRLHAIDQRALGRRLYQIGLAVFIGSGITCLVLLFAALWAVPELIIWAGGKPNIYFVVFWNLAWTIIYVGGGLMGFGTALKKSEQ